jgi:hypothetical protein
LRVHRSEAQTLDGRHSEGYTRSAFLTVLLGPLFSTCLTLQLSRALSSFPNGHMCKRRMRQAIDLPCVDVCKREVHLRALYSYPSGDAVSTCIRCEATPLSG